MSDDAPARPRRVRALRPAAWLTFEGVLVVLLGLWVTVPDPPAPTPPPPPAGGPWVAVHLHHVDLPGPVHAPADPATAAASGPIGRWVRAETSGRRGWSTHQPRFRMGPPGIERPRRPDAARQTVAAEALVLTDDAGSWDTLTLRTKWSTRHRTGSTSRGTTGDIPAEPGTLWIRRRAVVEVAGVTVDGLTAVLVEPAEPGAPPQPWSPERRRALVLSALEEEVLGGADPRSRRLTGLLQWLVHRPIREAAPLLATLWDERPGERRRPHLLIALHAAGVEPVDAGPAEAALAARAAGSADLTEEEVDLLHLALAPGTDPAVRAWARAMLDPTRRPVAVALLEARRTGAWRRGTWPEAEAAVGADALARAGRPDAAERWRRWAPLWAAGMALLALLWMVTEMRRRRTLWPDDPRARRRARAAWAGAALAVGVAMVVVDVHWLGWDLVPDAGGWTLVLIALAALAMRGARRAVVPAATLAAGIAAASATAATTSTVPDGPPAGTSAVDAWAAMAGWLLLGLLAWSAVRVHAALAPGSARVRSARWTALGACAGLVVPAAGLNLAAALRGLPPWAAFTRAGPDLGFPETALVCLALAGLVGAALLVSLWLGLRRLDPQVLDRLAPGAFPAAGAGR